jgi:type I restriction enzyme, R subunit
VLPTSNFGFLSVHDAQQVKLGALAERYFRDDPDTAIFKLQQFAELLSKTIAAHHALLNEGETFEKTLRRLSYDRIIPRETANILHTLRKRGNAAAHETRGSHSDALAALTLARHLGIWLHRTYPRRDSKSDSGAFSAKSNRH